MHILNRKLKESEPILYPNSLAVIKQSLACPTSVPPSTGSEKNPTPCGNQHPESCEHQEGVWKANDNGVATRGHRCGDAGCGKDEEKVAE